MSEEECNLSVLCKAKKFDRVRELLADPKVDANQADSTGAPAVYWVCLAGDLELLKLFHERGADYIATHTSRHYYCIHIVSQDGHFECARFLLQHGASTSVVDDDGDLPLHWLARSSQGDPKILDWLMMSSLDDNDVHQANEKGQSPLQDCSAQLKRRMRALALLRGPARMGARHLKLLCKRGCMGLPKDVWRYIFELYWDLFWVDVRELEAKPAQ